MKFTEQDGYFVNAAEVGNHRMEHSESPTYCIDCGQFEDYCDPEIPCSAAPSDEFDTRTTAGHDRVGAIVQGIFGGTDER